MSMVQLLHSINPQLPGNPFRLSLSNTSRVGFGDLTAQAGQTLLVSIVTLKTFVNRGPDLLQNL